MKNDNFLETLVASLTQTASVKNVFGDPIQAGNKVIIPVAQVLLGMGGGYGQGRSSGKQAVQTDSSETPGGGGGGGGLYAVARGVFEITPKKTRFIPTRSGQQVLAVLAVGFLLGRFFAPKQSRNAER